MVLPHFPLVDRSYISSILSDNTIHTCICPLDRSCMIGHRGKSSWNLAPFFSPLSATGGFHVILVIVNGGGAG